MGLHGQTNLHDAKPQQDQPDGSYQAEDKRGQIVHRGNRIPCLAAPTVQVSTIAAYPVMMLRLLISSVLSSFFFLVIKRFSFLEFMLQIFF